MALALGARLHCQVVVEAEGAEELDVAIIRTVPVFESRFLKNVPYVPEVAVPIEVQVPVAQLTLAGPVVYPVFNSNGASTTAGAECNTPANSKRASPKSFFTRFLRSTVVLLHNPIHVQPNPQAQNVRHETFGEGSPKFL